MPQPCKICKHPERQAIDDVLTDGWPSLRAIGAQYDVTKDSLLRHYRAHLAPTIEDVSSVEEERSEPRRIADLLPVKKREEPRQGAEDSTVTNSEALEQAEARYQAFIERWREALFISVNDMADWPEAHSGVLNQVLDLAVRRGDLGRWERLYYRLNAKKC